MQSKKENYKEPKQCAYWSNRWTVTSVCNNVAYNALLVLMKTSLAYNDICPDENIRTILLSPFIKNLISP